MITLIAEYFMGLRGPCHLGVLFGMVFIFVPISQCIEYKRMYKRWGRETNDEISRRAW